MNVSDYVYASKSSDCSLNVMCVDNSCKNENWLYHSTNSYWTINASSTSANSVFFVHSGGWLSDGRSGQYVHYQFEIQPVLFLRENVNIVSGEGTESAPYLLQ